MTEIPRGSWSDAIAPGAPAAPPRPSPDANPWTAPPLYGPASAVASPPPRGPRRKGRLLAAVTALVVLVGGGVAACQLTGDDTSGSPAAAATSQAPAASAAPKAPKAPPLPAEAAPVWASPREEGQPGATNALATWHTDDTLAVVRINGVKLFDQATGAVRAEVAPPEPGLQVCAATPEATAAGLGAVGWAKPGEHWRNSSCDRVSLVDVRNGGRTVWTTGSAGSGASGSFVADVLLGFVGDLLAVMTQDDVVALRLTDHSEAWSWRFPAGAGPRMLNTDMVTAPDVVAVLTEPFAGLGVHRASLTTIDATGRPLQAQPTRVRTDTDEWKVGLASASPVALVLERPMEHLERGIDVLALYGRDGAPGARFDLVAGGERIDSRPVDGTAVHHRFDMLFTATTLYATVDRAGIDSADAVVALDLGTGATKWVQPVTQALVPHLLSADEDGVRVLHSGIIGKSFVYANAAADGAPTRLTTLAASDRDIVPTSKSALVDVTPNRLFVTDQTSMHVGTMAYAAK